MGPIALGAGAPPFSMFGPFPIRLQFLRNKEAGQKFGNQLEIRRLDEAAFQEHVRSRLRPGYASTLRRYQFRHPEAKFYSVYRIEGQGPWIFDAVGDIGLWRLNPNILQYARPTQEWDDPDSLEWGHTPDSEIFPLREEQHLEEFEPLRAARFEILAENPRGFHVREELWAEDEATAEDKFLREHPGWEILRVFRQEPLT